jgi:hypothetical protein
MVVEKEMKRVAADYADGVTGRYEWSAEDFIANFTQIATSGSAPTRDAKKVVVDGKETTMGSNKMIWLNEWLTMDNLEALFKIQPNIRGTGTDKYEPGKQRLLLPAPIKHWLLESIALLGGEGRVYRMNQHMTLEARNMEELALLTARLGMVAKGGYAIASDFADHNILHEHRRMVLQWEKMAAAIDPEGASAAITIWKKNGMKAFAAKACRWAAAALDDVAARGKSVDALPGGDKQGYLQLIRGLWSGWRSTTFINTTFNEYYQKTTQESFRRAYGYDAIEDYHILGDDMAGSTVDEWTGLRFLELIDASGLDAQSVKQMLSKERLEYLRLMHGADGSVQGSANRAVSGLVSGDGQTSVVRAGLMTMRSVNESIHTLIRRSRCSNVEAWRYTLVRYWGTVEVKNAAGVYVKHYPSDAMLESASEFGGLGCSRYNQHPKELVGATAMRSTTMNVGWLGEQLDNNGAIIAVKKGAEHLHALGIRVSDHDNLLNDYVNNIIVGAIPASVSTRIRRDEWERLAEWYTANRMCVSRDLSSELECLKFDVVAHMRYLNPREMSKVVWNPWTVVQEAIAIALGPLAPAVSSFRKLRGFGGNRDSVWRSLINSQTSVKHRIAYATQLLGDKRVDQMLDGRNTGMTLPSSGVIPVTHNVITDHCLVSFLSAHRNYLVNIDDYEFSKCLALLGRRVELCILHSSYWRPQLYY